MNCNGCNPTDESNGYCAECVHTSHVAAVNAIGSDPMTIGDALTGLEATGAANSDVVLYCQLIREHGSWKRSHLYVMEGQLRQDPIYKKLLMLVSLSGWSGDDDLRARIINGLSILIAQQPDRYMAAATEYERTGRILPSVRDEALAAVRSRLNPRRRDLRAFLLSVCNPVLAQNVHVTVTTELCCADYSVCRVCDDIVSGMTLVAHGGCCGPECMRKDTETVARKPGETDVEYRKRANKFLSQQVPIRKPGETDVEFRKRANEVLSQQVPIP